MSNITLLVCRCSLRTLHFVLILLFSNMSFANLHHVANTQYLYADDDIRDVINNRIGDNLPIYISPTIPINSDASLVNAVADECINNVHRGKISLIPVNYNNAHWTAAVLRTDATGAASLYFNDPAGEQYRGAPLINRIIESMQVQLHDLKVRQQNDSTSCGAFTAEDLIALASVNSDELTLDSAKILLSSITDAGNLRKMHAQGADSKDISTNVDSTACTERQEQSSDKEELLKKVYQVSTSQNHAREASKVVSKHIRHRMFMYDVQISAVAAGDEELGAITGYSVWSSGTLGNAKQKAKTTGSNSYSTRVFGGSIGADVRFENDRLVGASLSKIRSNVKYEDQAASKKFDTYIVSMYDLNPIKGNLTLGLIGSAGISGKPRSKLLNLESHLHYKIGLPQEVTLIPYIGFKYEYEKAAAHKEQIASDLSIARGKQSYQAFSTEVGSRIIFKAIKLNDDAASNTSLTPTAHFSVERKIGSRGASSPYSLTYQGIGQEAGTSILAINPQHSKTSFNAGIGLIVSHKNIKLELLYDHSRQKQFKSHQGILKLKVNL